jgi:hypothetical protein
VNATDDRTRAERARDEMPDDDYAVLLAVALATEPDDDRR